MLRYLSFLYAMKIIILENIRSAYNVGNIIRTADSLGRQVWLTVSVSTEGES